MTKKTILLADDEEDIKTVITIYLESQGYRVLTAFDGLDALDKIQSEKPDLIFLDIMMPIMNGFEVCTKLKLDPATRDIPVVMLSSQDNIEVAVNCMKHQAFDYIVKSETAFLRLQKAITTIFHYQKIEKALSWYMEKM